MKKLADFFNIASSVCPFYVRETSRDYPTLDEKIAFIKRMMEHAAICPQCRAAISATIGNEKGD